MGSQRVRHTSHKTYINEQKWLCYNKSLFQRQKGWIWLQAVLSNSSIAASQTKNLKISSGHRKQYKQVKLVINRSVLSDSLWPHGLQPTRLLRPWNFPGKSTGGGCHFLLQGIFPTQESNPGLPHCRQTLNCLSHQGSREAYKLSSIPYIYNLCCCTKGGICPMKI